MQISGLQRSIGLACSLSLASMTLVFKEAGLGPGAAHSSYSLSSSFITPFPSSSSYLLKVFFKKSEGWRYDSGDTMFVLEA